LPREPTDASKESSPSNPILRHTLESPGTQKEEDSKAESPIQMETKSVKKQVYNYQDQETMKYVVRHPEANLL
jgi:hypothetical protein